MIATGSSNQKKGLSRGMTETLLWSLSRLKVTGEFQRSWESCWWSTPPFPLRERLTRVCRYFPTLVRHSQRGRRKKGPQLWEKSRGQVQQGLRRLKVCLSTRGGQTNAFLAVRALVPHRNLRHRNGDLLCARFIPASSARSRGWRRGAVTLLQRDKACESR